MNDTPRPGPPSRRSARRTGALAMLSAAAGVLLATMTASLSPGLIMRMGAFVGAGVAVESPVLAQSPSGSGGSQPVFRSKVTGNIKKIVLEGQEIWHYRSIPSGEGTWPGVLVLHDGWGLSQSLQQDIDALAAKGFVVMALEMNNRRVAMEPDKAREFATLMDEDRALDTSRLLLSHLKFLKEVGDHRVGLLGFGVGAKVALRAAMAGGEMSAVAVVYPLDPPAAEALRRVPCPLLAVYGGEDKVVPREKVEAFRTALMEAGRNAEVQVYDKAGHGFMNGMDPQHDAGAAADAWSLIAAFMRSHL